MRAPETKKPRGGSRGAIETRHSGKNGHAQSSLGRDRKLPANWRDRLPHAAVYYPARITIVGQPNSSGWAQARCPFHTDRTASLSVHLTGARGGWRCFAGCGSGDLVAFHIRLTGESFKEAVANLLRTCE